MHSASWKHSTPVLPELERYSRRRTSTNSHPSLTSIRWSKNECKHGMAVVLNKVCFSKERL